MKFEPRILLSLICATACTTASVMSSSQTDGSVTDTDGGADDSGSITSDATNAEDVGAVDAGECASGTFGAIDHSWSLSPSRGGIIENGAIVATPRGVAAAQLSQCPVIGYDLPDGFTEFTGDGDDRRVCGNTFVRRVTRAISHFPASAGVGDVVLAMSSEGARSSFLYKLGADASTFSENPIPLADGGTDYPYVNAMARDATTLRIAAESSNIPSHAVAMSYATGSLVNIDYEDTALKSYSAVTVAPQGIYYVGETMNGNVGVRRLTAGGTVDTAFGQNGLTEVAHAGAAGGVAVDSLGRILVASTTSTNQIFVVRLTATGELDSTFNGGHVDLSLTTTFRERIGMVAEPNGNVVVAGLVPSDAGDLPAVWLTRVAPDASVNSVSVEPPAPLSSVSSPPTRVALARDEKCGYLYGVALTGSSKLWRAHW